MRRKSQTKDDRGEEKGTNKKIIKDFRWLTVGWAGKGLYWSTGSTPELVTCVTEGSWKTTKHESLSESHRNRDFY